MGWNGIVLSLAISFVFYILEKTSNITENPLDKRSSGTPINSICRIIEIDIKRHLGEEKLPKQLEPKTTRNGSLYLD